MPKNYERYLEIMKNVNDESDCDFEQLSFELDNKDEECDEYE